MEGSNKSFEDYGGLFRNKKSQSSRAPQLLGNVTLSRDSVRHLVEALRRGEDPMLNLAAWKNVAKKTGENYFTLKATPPQREPPKATVIEDDPFEL